MVNVPADPTVVSRRNPVVSLIASTTTPSTMAPEASVADPEMVPLPPWPNSVSHSKSAVSARSRMDFNLSGPPRTGIKCQQYILKLRSRPGVGQVCRWTNSPAGWCGLVFVR